MSLLIYKICFHYESMPIRQHAMYMVNVQNNNFSHFATFFHTLRYCSASDNTAPERDINECLSHEAGVKNYASIIENQNN